VPTVSPEPCLPVAVTFLRDVHKVSETHCCLMKKLCAWNPTKVTKGIKVGDNKMHFFE
jgi:hypothetical protein